MADPDRHPDDHRRPRQPSTERLKFERRMERGRGRGPWQGRWQSWRDASPWKRSTPAQQAFGDAAARTGIVQGLASRLKAPIAALAPPLLALWVFTGRLLARWLAPVTQAARTVTGRVLGALRRAPWRRAWQVGALATASGLAVASVLASTGYAERPPAWGRQRLAERAGHGVYDAEGRLLGATFDHVTLPSGGEVDHASYGHVPAHAPLPTLYVRLLLKLEHKSHFAAWRNWCGTDVLSLAQRALTGTGGGSTLAHQLAKQLLEPDVRRSDFGPEALVQKAREWGTGCALHRALGGPDGVLRAFVDTAPVAQVRGTTRGPVSGAQVLFGLPLQQATPAMLAVLASLVQRPLSVVPEAAFSRGCEALRAAKGADAQALPPAEKLAKTQCHTLARARVALRAELPAGAELDAALEQIARWERTGLQPQDSFSPVPARRLVNVSERGRQLLGGPLLRHVASLADDASVAGGSPLTLSLVASDQLDFRTRLQSVLGRLDADPRLGELLCVTLLPGTAPRHCQGVPDGSAQAELVLVRVRVDDGGVVQLHHSALQAYRRPRQIGSLAKMVVLLAAVGRGLGPDTLVCPRAAQADGRSLRRETRPHLGFRACTPAQLITLAEATATSDNLAFFDLAKRLGEPALAQAAQALDLPLEQQTDGGSLAFRLSFGAAVAAPADLLRMGQALFAVAYGVPASAAAPQLLQLQPPQDATAWQAVAAMLPQPGQREVLRELLQAPVAHPRGTLAALARMGVAAGKTGTVSSPVTGPGQTRPYQQARLSLTYQPAERCVALVVVAGSEPQPLGQPRLPAQLIQPIRETVLGGLPSRGHVPPSVSPPNP